MKAGDLVKSKSPCSPAVGIVTKAEETMVWVKWSVEHILNPRWVPKWYLEVVSESR